MSSSSPSRTQDEQAAIVQPLEESHMPKPMRCKGVTYVSVGLASEDGPWQQTAECNDNPGCGFRVVMQEYSGVYRPEGSWDVTVVSDEFLPLHVAHQVQRQAVRDA